jgi:DNA-binding NtrC family response regulator
MLFRICIALDCKTQSRKLAQELSSDNISTASIAPKKNLISFLAKQSYDMYAISLSLLPNPVGDSISILKSLPETPAIVLITEAENQEEQAGYLAMGCDIVLNSSLPNGKIKAALYSIIENKREIQTEAIKNKQKLLGPQLSDFVSSSESMTTFMNLVRKVVNSNASLMLLGETGVGKERLARAIHEESSRSREPFIPVNCAALPDNLLESELFGHEQGAFTGASRQRRGAFEQAHKGTVFLDEIGDMPIHLQVKLLRILQEKEFTRLGGEKTIKVDVRIMAATNRPLKKAVESEEFRRDLYYRLSVVSLNLPPLRTRKEDIPELVFSYIRHFSSKIGSEVLNISPEALEAMKKYPWPGNVRELINVVERAMLLSEGNKIQLNDLPEEISHTESLLKESFALKAIDADNFTLSEEFANKTWKEVKSEILNLYEKAYLKALLKNNKGRIGKTAKEAGIEPRSLYNKMKFHNLDKNKFKL